MSKSFTLIELVVVTAIIMLISALVLPNFREGENALAIKRETYKVSQDIRRAEEMAMSSKEFEEEVPGGYGVYFKKEEPDHFIIFADIDNDKTYSASDKIVEDIILTKTEISGLSSGLELTIVFTPPDPLVTITPSAGSATVDLGKEEKQYTYQFVSKYYSQPLPRAGCDQNINTQDCPASFAALADSPTYVYDWFAETTVSYEYRWLEDVLGFQTPRASCDKNSSTKECPAVFSSSDQGSYLYDQFRGEPYQYVYTSLSRGHTLPRATHCDLDPNISECRSVSPFGDIYGGVSIVYDWRKISVFDYQERYFRQSTNQSQKFERVPITQNQNYSNRYQKKELTKEASSIIINSAGLITIE